MKYRSLFRASLIVFVLLGVVSSTALAAQSGPGTSTGTGQVFFPNPVASLQDQSLTDQKDANYPALQPAYKTVTLTNLDGSGYLQGDWANIHGETGNDTFSAMNTFIFTRDDERFEQVMAYYWVTEAQKYIQSLGFGTTRRPINMESQDVRINQYGVDNSYSWDKHDVLRFGKGGVDDAEDADVILHEFGHAIQDASAPGRFSAVGETGAMGEGFGDYWAFSANVFGPWAPCFADWDSEGACLRRLDLNKKFPRDFINEVHADGEIWSRALRDLLLRLRKIKADRLILKSHFLISANPTFSDGLQAILNADHQLFGDRDKAVICAVFRDRGIGAPGC